MDQKQLNFSEQEPQSEPRKKRSFKRSSFFTCLILILLFIGGCVLHKSVPSLSLDDPNAYDPVTLEPKPPEGLLKRIGHFVFHKEKKLAGEKSDRINVLLLGMGGIGHDGPFLTDTIIIASIKPSTNQIAMISIPRDLGVDIPGYGWRKINHANAFGEVDKPNWGAAFATEVIEETFNIDIQYYVRVDFKAFQEIIEEVDGVTVNVERAFTDPLFPAANDLYQTVSFSAGVQEMDGVKALQYARSRHGSNGEGSDFARAARQQKVLLALKEKILSFGTIANPVRINNVMKALDRHVTTNMEFSDIIALMKLAKELDTDNIVKLVLDNGTDGYLKNGFSASGAFILEPKSGNFNDINYVIEHIFDGDLSVRDDTPLQTEPAYSPANIEVQNGTWQAGMAARIQRKLDDSGFHVTSIGNTDERPIEESGLYAISSDAPNDVMQGLVETLHIPIKETPDTITAVSSTDILIILGENFNE